MVTSVKFTFNNVKTYCNIWQLEQQQASSQVKRVVWTKSIFYVCKTLVMVVYINFYYQICQFRNVLNLKVDGNVAIKLACLLYDGLLLFGFGLDLLLILDIKSISTEK